jgi:hypothetical protein
MTGPKTICSKPKVSPYAAPYALLKSLHKFGTIAEGKKGLSTKVEKSEDH